MRAGKMRDRVVIEQSTPSRNSIGDDVDSWSVLDTVSAAIDTAGGREFEAAAQTNATLTHLVRIRYRATITTAMRLVWRGRYLDIQSVENIDDRNREIILMCVEKV